MFRQYASKHVPSAFPWARTGQVRLSAVPRGTLKSCSVGVRPCTCPSARTRHVRLGASAVSHALSTFVYARVQDMLAGTCTIRPSSLRVGNVQRFYF